MEIFSLALPSGLSAELASTGNSAPTPLLCGVVSSGNLEVLVEAWPEGLAPSVDAPGMAHCLIEVSTSATGFRDIWHAVLRDFADRHALAGLRLSINDAGATPAVVSLRLDQAFEGYRSQPQSIVINGGAA